MEHIDLAIRGATLITATGRFLADVGISGGRIAALVEPGASLEADRTIEAAGRHLMPGAIDVHSHHREPGFTHKDDIVTSTRQCAAGGVTTSFAMPNVDPPPNTPERLDAMLELYERKAIVETGTSHEVGRILEAVRAFGLKPADIDALLVSHIHLDHAGGLEKFAGSGAGWPSRQAQMSGGRCPAEVYGHRDRREPSVSCWTGACEARSRSGGRRWCIGWLKSAAGSNSGKAGGRRGAHDVHRGVPGAAMTPARSARPARQAPSE